MNAAPYVAVLICGLATPTHVCADGGGLVRVVDGDSINLGRERHRLQGIDAPERNQHCRRPDGSEWRCGRAAANALIEKIGGNPVSCHTRGRDRYGRFLSVCRAGGVNLNRWMVLNGWAVAYRRYSHRFIPEEETAKHRRLGLWSGRFVTPRDWRRGKRLPSNPAMTKRHEKP